jgi:hypothetical protein
MIPIHERKYKDISSHKEERKYKDISLHKEKYASA